MQQAGVLRVQGLGPVSTGFGVVIQLMAIISMLSMHLSVTMHLPLSLGTPNIVGNHTGGTSVSVVQREEQRFEIQRCGAKLEGCLTGKFLHAIQRVHMFYGARTCQ